MRLLHTADLHLGRSFCGLPLDDDHGAVLNQIATAVRDVRADVLIIAGDIFDRAAPPANAVRQFNEFIARIATDTDAAVVLIAGNHDSGDRIASMAIMTDTRRALIRGPVSSEEKPLILSDQYGPIAFSALPFAYEYAARECFSDETIQTPEDVLRAQIAAAWPHVPQGARWVVAAHTFVSGARTSDSERSLTRIGGLETVSAEIFERAHYVALGHLHRPQFVAPHIRYSGSPLAFGFDEARAEKSMSFVEIEGAGQVTVEEIPFTPLREVRMLTGLHSELLLSKPSEDFIKVVLNDKVPVIDAMRRLRDVFPNACELSYARDERAPQTKSLDAHTVKAVEPVDVIGDFLELVRDNGLSEEEQTVIRAALEKLHDREDME